VRREGGGVGIWVIGGKRVGIKWGRVKRCGGDKGKSKRGERGGGEKKRGSGMRGKEGNEEVRGGGMG